MDDVRRLLEQLEHDAELVDVVRVDQTKRPEVQTVRTDRRDVHAEGAVLFGGRRRRQQVHRGRRAAEERLELLLLHLGLGLGALALLSLLLDPIALLALLLELAPAHASTGGLDPALESLRGRPLVVRTVLVLHLVAKALEDLTEVVRTQTGVPVRQQRQTDHDVGI